MPHLAGDILMLIVLAVCMAGSAFFSGSETALFSLTKHQRLQLKRSRTVAGGAIGVLLAETRPLLVTVLLGNMTVNVLYFVVSTVLMMRVAERHELSAVVVAGINIVQVLTLILFCEVSPKLIAARLPVPMAKLTALPLLVVHRALAPARGTLIAFVIAPLSRLIAPRQASADLSTEELGALLELSQQRGVIDPDEEQMLQQVLELSQLKVRDLMTPRVDIKAHDIADDPARLMDVLRQTRLTAIPVYRDTLDRIEGMLYARQVLLVRPKTAAQVRRLARQVMFVPEVMRGDRLLVQFRKTGTTYAIAVDEYGGTAGLVTLENVVEQMIGEITGPFESETPPEVQPIGEGIWRVRADLSIHDWADAFGARFHNPDVSTVGGLVMANLGRLPKVGDKTVVGNVTIEVESVKGRRIEWLRMSLATASEPVAAAAGEART